MRGIVLLSIVALSGCASSNTGATAVNTTVQATARPVNFAGEHARCASTGALEARIADAVKAQVQGGA